LLRTLPCELGSGLHNLRQLWIPSNHLSTLPEALCAITSLEWL
jgi:hypothetical protein